MIDGAFNPFSGVLTDPSAVRNKDEASCGVAARLDDHELVAVGQVPVVRRVRS